MRTITKERVAGIANGEKCYTHDDVVELARIALASLVAESKSYGPFTPKIIGAGVWTAITDELPAELEGKAVWLSTAPPAPVENTELQRKAAIHDALCEKYNVESLDDFVDWQRNHIAELEAAPPAPVGEGETAVMPDYPGYVMTQRECFQAGKKAGLTEAGKAPVIPDGWVACSERMPEQFVEVLACTEGGGRYVAALNQRMTWDGGDFFDDIQDVNHWQPLPSPPAK